MDYHIDEEDIEIDEAEDIEATQSVERIDTETEKDQ